jgi:hypothetical protein
VTAQDGRLVAADSAAKAVRRLAHALADGSPLDSGDLYDLLGALRLTTSRLSSAVSAVRGEGGNLRLEHLVARAQGVLADAVVVLDEAQAVAGEQQP